MNITFWKDIRVLVVLKEAVNRINKGGKGKHTQGFVHKTYGDVPVANYNDETKQFEEVVNTRGRAYAARKRQQYRKPTKERRYYDKHDI